MVADDWIIPICYAACGATVVGAAWIFVETMRIRKQIRLKLQKQAGPQDAADWPIIFDRMTCRKSRGILEDRPGSYVGGFVITRAGDQLTAIVYQAGVRWLTPGEMWELMHPTPKEVAALMAQQQASGSST
jgi:hypothetical protein